MTVGPSNGSNSSPSSMYRIHHGTLMATTGLQEDGRMFAKAILQSFATSDYDPSVEEIAKAGAFFQHELTLDVGISDEGTSLEVLYALVFRYIGMALK